MKKILVLLALGFGLPLQAGLRDSVTLEWTFDGAAPDTFIVHTSTDPDLPLAEWPVLLEIPATEAGKLVLEVTIKMVPGSHFFYLTAKNFWGESDPSNTVNTPAAPGRGFLRIR